MTLRQTALPPLLLLLAMAACRDEPQIDPQKLDGKWFILSGTREGIESDAFDGAYIEFNGEKMVTNLPIPDPNFTEIPMGFSIKKDVLTQKPEGVEGVDLKITTLTDSLLVLDFELRKLPFHLVFGKTVSADTIPLGMPN